VLVVIHVRAISARHCSGPHLGELIRDLTLAHVKQMDCGSYGGRSCSRAS
jgi:hypothetical protein